jgi:molybdenum cofactor synthesis domain-containing protein
VFAGARAPPPLGPGEARRIATGAPVPPGADAVARVEDTREEEGQVVLRAPVRPGLFIDPAGSDLPQGATVLEAGVDLTPARLGLLASVGLAGVPVFARPRVSLFSSGDELLQPGAPADPWRIYDSNGTSLRALFEDAGAALVREPSLPDDLDALRSALRGAASRSGLVVFSGGASVGAKDLVVDAVRAEGEVLFHGVRVKPGKPLLAGRVGDALVVGLPGNPTSALSNACLFLVPALRRMARLPDARQDARAARLARGVKAEGDRFLFLPVRLEGDRAVPTFRGSGALTSMAASDGWVGVPEGVDLPEGAPVLVHPW